MKSKTQVKEDYDLTKDCKVSIAKNITAAYIHIPFCNSICHYCDFAKFLYQENWVTPYLQALEKEIHTAYQNEYLQTIYVGGGTPTALNDAQFLKLLKLIDTFQKQKNYEYTIECNVESLNETKIKYMQQYGVNRISIGVETFHEHHLKAMNRHHTKEQIKETIALLKRIGLDNINLDFMYALPNETLQEVKEDIKEFLKLDVPHISTYSLMIESNTLFHICHIVPICQELDFKMYQTICKTLEENGYKHYEISNFAKKNYASKHNLTYWNNEFYYGFGLGASGYIHSIRYTNTRSLKDYCDGNFCLEKVEMTERINMENEMILGLRKIEGVSAYKFKQKYGKEIASVFPIEELNKKGKLHIQNGWIKIPKQALYQSNDILMCFIGEENESNKV